LGGCEQASFMGGRPKLVKWGPPLGETKASREMANQDCPDHREGEKMVASSLLK